MVYSVTEVRYTRPNIIINKVRINLKQLDLKCYQNCMNDRNFVIFIYKTKSELFRIYAFMYK